MRSSLFVLASSMLAAAAPVYESMHNSTNLKSPPATPSSNHSNAIFFEHETQYFDAVVDGPHPTETASSAGWIAPKTANGTRSNNTTAALTKRRSDFDRCPHARDLKAHIGGTDTFCCAHPRNGFGQIKVLGKPMTNRCMRTFTPHWCQFANMGEYKYGPYCCAWIENMVRPERIRCKTLTLHDDAERQKPVVHEDGEIEHKETYGPYDMIVT